MIKPVIKYSAALLGIVILGLVALAIIRHYSAEYQARRELEKIVEEYKNDPYGGETPEETLQLFIDALKKDDIDLAVKYFVLDKQEEWKENLSQIKEKNKLDVMIRDLANAGPPKPISPNNPDYVNFYIANEKNELVAVLTITKAQNHRWKIQKL